jgi:hypothetical protein
VLFDNGIKNFYLVSIADGSSTTTLYTGSVDKIENIGKETARAKDIVSAASTAGNSTSITANPSVSTSTATATSATTPANAPKPALNNSQGAITPGRSILQTLTDSNSEAVNSVGGNQEVQPTSIPGFSVDEQAVSVKTGLVPVYLDKNTAAQQAVLANLSQKEGTNTTTKR